jgi:hypothetical protein
LQEGERFCAQCGKAAGTPPPAGASRIELDPALVNRLLALYASKPGGPQLRLEEGQLRAQVGEHWLAINPIRLDEVAQVLVSAGELGKLSLSIDLVHLGERGLEVQLRLA